MLCGFRRYAAYEHGTIRYYPFQDEPLSRLCALSYREAPVVFVTNSDTLPSARRLGLTDEQVVYLPHAVDSARLFAFADANGHRRPPTGGPPVVFSPTRHDWVERHVNLSKDNDVLIRGLALARDEGFPCRARFVEWGRDVAASRRLISELALDEWIEWVPTMRKRELWDQYLTTHAVADQFFAPAIGGVTFEALALGRRVITAMDGETSTTFFGVPPPVLAAKVPEEVAAAAIAVARDPEDCEGRGAASRSWFERFHSRERIIQLQVRAYARVLASG
jgi:glycosyltransferase involved in cell wall biosynthesis